MSHRTDCTISLVSQLLSSPAWDMDYLAAFLVHELTTDTWRVFFSCIVGSSVSP